MFLQNVDLIAFELYFLREESFSMTRGHVWQGQQRVEEEAESAQEPFFIVIVHAKTNGSLYCS